MSRQLSVADGAYTIDHSGALHLVIGSLFAAGVGPNWGLDRPTDNFVYFVNAGSNNVSAYHFKEGNRLVPVTGSHFPAGHFAGGITTAPSPLHEPCTDCRKLGVSEAIQA